MPRRSFTVLAVSFLLAVSLPVHAVVVPPSTMGKWAVKNIVLCAQNTYADWQAYQVVRVTGTFVNGATTLKVQGFWDGKGVAPCTATQHAFNVRFTPHIQGGWNFTITNNSNDNGLRVDAAEAGTITVNAPVASPPPASTVPRGFLRRDVPAGSTVGSYIWGTGAHQFVWGQTYYQIVNREASGDQSWKTAVDNSTKNTSTQYNMNKIRMLISPWTTAGGTVDSQPYKQTNNVLNKDQLNIPHWQALDRIVQYLNDRNVMAEVVIFRDQGDDILLGTALQDCRYLRYAVSRYAAYPNVIWSLSNEWDLAKNSPAYWNDLGAAIRGNAQSTCTGSDFSTPLDPWFTSAGKDRVLTIHPANRDPLTNALQWCFEFAGSSWPSAASIQSHKTNDDIGDPNFKADFRGYQSIACNRSVPNTTPVCTLPSPALPVSNDEYGYISVASLSQTEHRNAIWGIATGGGYGTAGDGRGNPSPIQTTAWAGALEYDDIKRLVSFFTSTVKGIEYWKMVPQTACQANTRVHTLAEVGRQYVTYTADGAAGFAVTGFVAGQYQRTWYNPRTADPNDPNANSGSQCLTINTNSFTPPSGGGDWVLLLRKTTACP